MTAELGAAALAPAAPLATGAACAPGRQACAAAPATPLRHRECTRLGAPAQGTPSRGVALQRQGSPPVQGSTKLCIEAALCGRRASWPAAAAAGSGASTVQRTPSAAGTLCEAGASRRGGGAGGGGAEGGSGASGKPRKRARLSLVALALRDHRRGSGSGALAAAEAEEGARRGAADAEAARGAPQPSGGTKPESQGHTAPESPAHAPPVDTARGAPLLVDLTEDAEAPESPRGAAPGTPVDTELVDMTGEPPEAAAGTGAAAAPEPPVATGGAEQMCERQQMAAVEAPLATHQSPPASPAGRQPGNRAAAGQSSSGLPSAREG